MSDDISLAMEGALAVIVVVGVYCLVVLLMDRLGSGIHYDMGISISGKKGGVKRESSRCIGRKLSSKRGDINRP